MTTFSDFSNILPDPDNKINAAGVSDNTTGTAGPGFAKIKFKSEFATQRARTLGGRGISASPSSHFWSFDINYNELLRPQFQIVNNFLEMRKSLAAPFFVVLPQYSEPQDSTFATYLASNTITVYSSSVAGKTSMLIDVNAAGGSPTQGDFFTIQDPDDAIHMKAYKVTRIETNSYYQTGTTQPTVNQRRIHFSPPLVRSVSDNATLTFLNPRFRVEQVSDIIEYDLDANGLYDYSLSVQEVLP